MSKSEREKAGSLPRAAKILSALAHCPRGAATVAELAHWTLLPRPTVHRVTRELCTLGWLHRDNSSGRLEIAAGLSSISQASFVARLQNAASLTLHALALQLGRTLYLDVRSGLDLACVGRYAGNPSGEREYGFVNMRAPFGATPATMAMMARLPQCDVEAILSANAERYTILPGFDRGGFERCRQKADAAGACFGGIVLDRRMCGLGVAINLAGTPVAGIGMTYPRAGLSPADRVRCLQLLRTAAGQIAARVGGAATSPQCRRQGP